MIAPTPREAELTAKMNEAHQLHVMRLEARIKTLTDAVTDAAEWHEREAAVFWELGNEPGQRHLCGYGPTICAHCRHTDRAAYYRRALDSYSDMLAWPLDES